MIDRKVCEIWKDSNIWTFSVRSKLFRKITFIRTTREELLVCTCFLYHYMLFSAQKKWKNSIFDKIIQIDFFKNLFDHMQDFIIFYHFLMSFDIWNTTTPIFMGSSSACKITHFCSINHVVVKRGVIHEEFLWKLFFRKVLIFLNTSIFYHFFISHILFKLSAFEVRLQNPFLSTNSL